MKLLLLGHGYLGQAISREFLAAGWQVTAISRHGDSSNPQSAIRNPQLLELACDLTSPSDVAALSTRISPPDLLIHCASSGRGGAEAYRSVYLEGCQHLLDAFPQIPLIFTSSTSVYAQTDGSEVTEESPAEPDRDTGKILRETEELVLASGGTVARLAGIYGPGRSVLLKKFLSGDAVIEEDGGRFLNQIHRDDAAQALLRLGSQISNLKSQIFNVSDSRPLTQLECYTGLARLFAKPLPPTGPRDLNRKRGWTHKRVSNAKLRATGWQPEFPRFLDAASGIAATL
ncbi:MAG TPA: NAD-dependent epimerase/dehydratase family protein [Luteolibacter sp.]